MRIAIKGRNLHVSERLKEHVDRRFAKVGRQVSELAELELELYEERNPSNPDCARGRGHAAPQGRDAAGA